MDWELIKLEVITEMDHIIDNYEHNLARITIGRANPKFLESVQIDYYGTHMPITELAAVSISEANQLVIKPYDIKTIKSIVEVLNLASLDLQINNEGDRVRIIFPLVTLERRKKLVKSIAEFTEKSKLHIRGVRQKFNKEIKSHQDLSEDLIHNYHDEIQEFTDKYIAKILDMTNRKNEQLLSI